MIKVFALILFFITALYAVNDQEILKRADSFLKSSSKSNQFRAYNDYKNLYLRALLNGDNKLKHSALKGIISSGHRLHIDVKRYEQEYKHLSHTSKKNYKAKKNIQVTSSHKLKSVRFYNKRLVLQFDKNLQKKQVNYFTLSDKKKSIYKYVFDIHASMLKKSNTLKQEGVDKIKLAQYNPNTLRLVIQNKTPLKIRFFKKGKELSIKIINKSVKTKKKSPKRLDRNKIIVIDAGHGGKDPGAIGYRKYREKIVVLSIARELKRILRARGFTVYMTRDSDRFIKLRNRTKYANRKNADIFISIHANAVGRKDAKRVCGLECYFLSTSRSSRAKKVAEMENSADLDEMDYYGKQSFLNTINSHNIVASNKLAIDLQRGALATLKSRYKNVKDAGVREGPFWVLVGAQMPSVLVEVGFITHPTEARRLVSRSYQKTMAQGLANGVERYFINSQKR
ncbi:N-acetylmuramoyl-L-alanine amidase [Sulfurimonas sp. SWIR-19]|uniref:N-acetylmuramoyl-L-alanine amidase family protein n=1 Tax=Sulfurimonas sp. SWIR-19 TaxID=2878390 RepID=UPI001CF27FE6|nr:N-acetylmuramoyl-L-alanine amidase [Sulfurimonas sp. SWIR-19]UCM99636.1 N-acetylmuramoyl-L-alanine amidase [Sulfurimonas sp. SWIR-19]